MTYLLFQKPVSFKRILRLCVYVCIRVETFDFRGETSCAAIG